MTILPDIICSGRHKMILGMYSYELPMTCLVCVGTQGSCVSVVLFFLLIN